MNAVDELCNLHDYIEEHFEDAEFISAETPNRSWDREMVTIRFSLSGRRYKYALSDETQEAKDEDNK